MEENRQGLSDIVVETRRDGTSVGKIDLLHYSLHMYLLYDYPNMTHVILFHSIKVICKVSMSAAFDIIT